MLKFQAEHHILSKQYLNLLFKASQVLSAMLFMEEREFLHGGRISFLFWGGWGGRELFSFPSSTEQMQMSCCCLTPPPVVPVLAVVVLRVQEQPAHTPTPRGASNWEYFTGCSCSWCRLHGSPPGYSTYSLPPPDRYTCLAQMHWQRETTLGLLPFRSQQPIAVKNSSEQTCLGC